MEESSDSSSSLSSDVTEGVRLETRKETSGRSSSSFSKKGGGRPPVRASEWKLCHLENIGIAYEEHSLPLSDFMSRLKTNRVVEKNRLTDLPTLNRKLIDFIENVWTFSCDFSDEGMDQDVVTISEMVKEVEDALESFESKQPDIESELADELKDHQMKILYYTWQFSLVEFFKFCCMLLSRWKRSFQREGKFTNLFMAFAKIFFLQPETGESFSEYIILNRVAIHGIPAIRYMTYCTDDGGKKGQKVLIVTEVKKYDSFRGSSTAENFSFRNLSSEVLGKHGIELLMERRDSFFFPGVVGIICVGTKVIFTYLEVTRSHFDKIQSESEVDKDQQKAFISYTRPFDFMDSRDRKEIVEPLAWFGYLQRGAYKSYR